MFKGSGLSSQLRKLPRGPDLSELQQILSQALEQRGKVATLGWRGSNLMPFNLEVVCNLKNANNAQWRLITERNGKRVELFEYTSCDVLLVYNLVISSCLEAQQQSGRTSSTKLPAATEPLHPAAEPSAAIEQMAPDPQLQQEPAAALPKTSGFQAAANTLKNTPSAASKGEHSLFNVSPKMIEAAAADSAQDAEFAFVPEPESDPRASAASAPAKTAVATSSAPGATPAAASIAPDPSDKIPREGSLKKLPIADLLSLIASTKGSGCLDVRNHELSATVFIQNGQPVDATAGDAIGDEAMIVLLTWPEGTFAFEPRVLRNNHTVHESIESLLRQSKLLTEHLKFLRTAGMQPASILVQKNPDVQEQEFIERVTGGAPCDVSILGRVYCSLNGSQSLNDIVREQSLSRINVVHIVQHLIARDLIKFDNDARPLSNLILEPRVIDNAAIQSIMMSLRRMETGLFNYPAFLYFLEQEYLRSFRSRTAFSVVVFEMRQKKIIDGEIVKRVLPEQAIMDAVLRISQLKRHVDLLAHYDAYDFALLLPNTKAQGASVFVNRFVKAVTERPLAGGIDPSNLTLSCGISAVPEDFKELSAMLGAADLAMNQARERHSTVVLYRDIKNQVTVNAK
ncbi:MAG TPA: DUF4388 domain-containing protein [Trichormus sp.]|jgi:diguanylate cyclase (GGDEF)-like protein